MSKEGEGMFSDNIHDLVHISAELKQIEREEEKFHRKYGHRKKILIEKLHDAIDRIVK